jgi:hypothetical protein
MEPSGFSILNFIYTKTENLFRSEEALPVPHGRDIAQKSPAHRVPSR